MKAVFFRGPNARQFDISKCLSVLKAASSTSASTVHKDNSFLVYHPRETQKRAEWWSHNLPWIKPYYAVKCNSSPLLITSLAKAFSNSKQQVTGRIISDEEQLNESKCDLPFNNNMDTKLGFDCASATELQLIDSLFPTLQMNRNVILSNPTKKTQDFVTSNNFGVETTVASTISELNKIAQFTPNAKVLIRLRVENPQAASQMLRFGCTEDQVPSLLDHMRHLKINFVGFHFHVGSGGPMSFGVTRAAEMIFRLMPEVLKRGMILSIVDMGGGFTPQYVDADLPAIRSARVMLEIGHSAYFVGDNKPLQMWAEPGRLLAQESFTLVCTVLDKEVQILPNGQKHFVYQINDSLYGTFSGIRHDEWNFSNHQNCFLWKYNKSDATWKFQKTDHKYHTTLTMQTCDGHDVFPWFVFTEELNIGDMIIFGNMGAYAQSSSCAFNGMPVASRTLVAR